MDRPNSGCLGKALLVLAIVAQIAQVVALFGLLYGPQEVQTMLDPYRGPLVKCWVPLAILIGLGLLFGVRASRQFVLGALLGLRKRIRHAYTVALRSLVTRTAKGLLAQSLGPPHERTQRVAAFQAIVEAVEQGYAVVADERVASVVRVLEQATMIELEDLPPTMTVGDVEFVRIPPGEFAMGSDEGASGREEGRSDETPLHSVYTGAFYIGRYPTTNHQYERFVGATGYSAPDHWYRGSIPSDKAYHPVRFVNWHDVRAYCQWLAEETGQVVRLPTEAEWEKAARGADGREYPWGDGFDQGRCNTRDSLIIRDTTFVGTYSPRGDSPYRAVDMAGNVCEWTSSLEKAYPYNAGDGRENPEVEGRRVLRGGSFFMSPDEARVWARFSSWPHFFLEYSGLRVVLLPPVSP